MAETDGPQLAIERIYLRDASFESPRAPGVFDGTWNPQMQVDINTRSNRLDEVRHEVVLTLTLKARVEDDVSMIVELQQAGVFRLQGMDDGIRQQALAVTCPNILFPYAREAIDALVTKGAFPAVMLAPISFEALFAEAMRRREAEGGGEGVIADDRSVN